VPVQQTLSLPWTTATPVQKLMRRIRQIARRNSYVQIGPHIMEVPQDMTLAFFRNGDYYERSTSYWIEKLLAGTTQQVFYDIGANYGYYCLKLAPLATHIYAFEPVSRTHAMLQKNIERNGITNIIAYQRGVTDRDGTAQIYLHRTRFFPLVSGSSSLFHSSLSSAGQETISVVTLDSILQEQQLLPPAVIKIDIEGGELYVLRGAREVLNTYHPILVMEFNGLEIFEDVGYARTDLLTFLQDLHYVVYGLSSNVADFTAYPLNRFAEIQVENIIALPQEMEHLIKEA